MRGSGFPELIGHLSLHGGNMEFEYGPLALAMKYGGLFLLNEIDLLEPSAAAGYASLPFENGLTLVMVVSEPAKPGV